jgi:serine/threonine-protein phosphatase 2B catalytic subunit
MDVFSWSMPFLAEKVMNMLYTVVKKGGDDEEGDDVNLGDLMKKDTANMSTEE